MAYEDNPPEHRKKLATAIIRARLDKSLEVSQVAEAVGCSKSTINDLERGISNPKWDTVYNICEYLGINLLPPTSIIELLSKKEEPSPERSIDWLSALLEKGINVQVNVNSSIDK